MSQNSIDWANLHKNAVLLEQRIQSACLKAGRKREEVTLIAVSKLQPCDLIREATTLGQRVFGENYVQEAKQKQMDLKDLQLNWHLIGHLQKNKAKLVVGEFSLIHSVDSLELAQLLNRICSEKDLRQAVLLEVNLSGEGSKSGMTEKECLELVSKAKDFPRLIFSGLMTMPPLSSTPENSRSYFKKLNLLLAEGQSKLSDSDQKNFCQLSMGTTGDFEVAIEEGATLIRVGTAYFGERPVK